jgi:hypothetical protein
VRCVGAVVRPFFSKEVSMRRSTRPLAVAVCLTAACRDATTAVRPTIVMPPASAFADVGGVVLSVTGSGHVLRNLTGEPELTTFSYSAIKRADGRTNGNFQINFRAATFSIKGTVTCVTALGNTAWIGGVIDWIKSDDPADQSFTGTDVWWRVTDNGQGAGDPPDLTTSILFTLPGSPITAESWCRDQSLRALSRPIDHGNIQVRSQ